MNFQQQRPQTIIIENEQKPNYEAFCSHNNDAQTEMISPLTADPIR